MKKYIKYILLTAWVSMLGLSCSENIDNDIPGNKAYIINSGKNEIVLYNLGEKDVYQLSIYRSGKFGSAGTAKVNELTQAELDVINTENETSYKAMPKDAYSILNTEVSFTGADEDVTENIKIEIDPSIAKKYMLQDPNYVIPIQIASSTWTVNEEKNISLISIDVKEPYVYFRTTSGVEMNEYKAGEVPAQIKITLPVTIDFNNKWDFSAELTMDQELVDEYNEAHGTFFSMLSQDIITLDNKIDFKPGDKEVLATVVLDGEKIPYGNYMVPVKLAEVSKFAIDADRDQYLVGVSLMAPELSREKWEVIDFSTQAENEGELNKASAILDGDLATFWHSRWASPGSTLPHHLTIDMKEEKTITHVGIARRNNNSDTKDVEFYISSDNANWKQIGKHEMQLLNGLQTTGVLASKGRYLKVVVAASRRAPHASIAEVAAYGF